MLFMHMVIDLHSGSVVVVESCQRWDSTHRDLSVIPRGTMIVDLSLLDRY